jgi:hypothetical protein
MHVSCKKTGGIAGLEIYAEVDSERLSRAQALEMRELAERARAFDQPAKPGVKSMPDQFQYEITVEDQGKRRSFVTNDAAASDELMDLIDWLIETAHKDRSKEIRSREVG